MEKFDRPREIHEDPITYGVATGRLAASTASEWRHRLETGEIDTDFIESLPTPIQRPDLAAALALLSDGAYPAGSSRQPDHDRCENGSDHDRFLLQRPTQEGPRPL
jgi:hypothetical protein